MGIQDFTLINRTGTTIKRLYISPADTSDWEEDVLGRDMLHDGEQVTIQFNADDTAAIWDMKIVDEDDDEATWTALNLATITQLTLRYDKSGDPVADFQ